MALGIDPVSRLTDKSKYLRFVNLKRLLGSEEMKQFVPIDNVTSQDNSPN